jgi:crooked neck
MYGDETYRRLGLLGKLDRNVRKEKIFIEVYLSELALGEVDRCRSLYSSYLKAMPHSTLVQVCGVKSVGDGQNVALFSSRQFHRGAWIYIEMLWKGYIDFEIEKKWRCTYQKIIRTSTGRTGHVKVWISFAQFEGTEIGSGLKPHEMFSRRRICSSNKRKLE